MTSKQIVWVIDPRDKHSTLVLPHLDREPVVIEPARIPETGFEVSFLHDTDGDIAYVDGHELRNVGAIWWRKMLELATEWVPHERIDPRMHDYVNRGVRRHADGFGAWFGESVLWVSNPHASARASNKAWQLRLARQLGLAVPRTLQTSSPARAKQFASEEWARGNDVIVKSLANHFPKAENGTDLMFWSQTLPRNSSFEGLELAPSIFQQFIKGYDLRVTIVGERIFAAKVTTDSDLPVHIPDIRIVGQGIHGNLDIVPYVLPPEIEVSLQLLMKRLDLQYGSVDFRVDNDGVYQFLEINTLGAWGYVEGATGQPIGKTLAELLMSA